MQMVKLQREVTGAGVKSSGYLQEGEVLPVPCAHDDEVRMEARAVAKSDRLARDRRNLAVRGDDLVAWLGFFVEPPVHPSADEGLVLVAARDVWHGCAALVDDVVSSAHLLDAARPAECKR